MKQRWRDKRGGERTMKGYCEWTSHSHLIAELPSRQQKWQPKSQRQERDKNETTQNKRTKPKALLDEANI